MRDHSAEFGACIDRLENACNFPRMLDQNLKQRRGRPRLRMSSRLINACEAARIIDNVHESTVRRWIKNGWTSFGYPLDVVVRKHRLVIPQFKALEVKEILQDHPLPPAGATRAEVEEFRRAVSLLCDVRPRSNYSYARRPKAKAPQP